MIDKEAFDTWRDNPVTQWVLGACKIAADDAFQMWVNKSWHGGDANWQSLIELRARADTYLDIVNMDYSDITKAYGEENE